MDRFKVLDISGDVGLTAFGKSREEAFVNAAIGMYSLITDLEKVEEKQSIHIDIEKSSSDSLLVSWLNELIFEFDTYGFVGRNIQLEFFTENRIAANIAGEEFDPERHEGKLLIKAATYHRLRIEKVNNIWEIDVIFDI